ncbi:hypothetical protein B0T25DRAFT_2874 [Lasiosphaeria hispida]|uniref:Uncharacterized protein n=1 Tax=Lasiosphaeria hispida TaxID=260671 RepID=A0AAJ0HSX9_9PEZI|nr:hypothetical protein B0T25DRAFT_2874 [Lasiosphaeria hispida]
MALPLPVQRASFIPSRVTNTPATSTPVTNNSSHKYFSHKHSSLQIGILFCRLFCRLKMSSFTPINPRSSRVALTAQPTLGQATSRASGPTPRGDVDMLDRPSREDPPSSTAESAQPDAQAAEIDTGVEPGSVSTSEQTPPSTPLRAARKPLPTSRPARHAPAPAPAHAPAPRAGVVTAPAVAADPASPDTPPDTPPIDRRTEKTKREQEAARRIQKEGVRRPVPCRGCGARQAKIQLGGRRNPASDELLPCTVRSSYAGPCARCKSLKETCQEQEGAQPAFGKRYSPAELAGIAASAEARAGETAGAEEGKKVGA